MPCETVNPQWPVLAGDWQSPGATHLTTMNELSISIAFMAAIFFFVAFFYSSVGLGGGSSYTALLALSGAGILTIPTVSLSLNVVVTTVGSLVFLKNRHLRLRLITPFLVTSIPMAYLGGALKVSNEIYSVVLLLSLLLAASRIYFPGKAKPLVFSERGRLMISLLAGSALGLIAGVAGIGGGVYLVPLILLLGFGTAREAAACGAVFVWVNSISGLISRLQHNPIDMTPFLPLLGAVMAGGLAGAIMGSSHFTPRTMEQILGSILLVAIFSLGRKIALAM